MNTDAEPAVKPPIEDCKSRVFQFETTKMATSDHVDRLLLGLHLANWWATRLGLATIRHGQRRRYDRADRRDQIVVRLGIRRLRDGERRGRLPLLLVAWIHGRWVVPGMT